MLHNQSYFITGTTTDIGKTFISALLVKAFNATYWKPFQTGLSNDDGDSKTVENLTGITSYPPLYKLQAPLSPLEASKKENIHIPDNFLSSLELPYSQSPLIVEGAGGLMVPITNRIMMIDVIKKLNLPTILVTSDKLGTLNHTLLSLHAMKQYGLNITGFIMNRAQEKSQNSKIISDISGIPCLFSIPPIKLITKKAFSNFFHDIKNNYLEQDSSISLLY